VPNNDSGEQDLSALDANVADGKRIDWSEAESSASGTPTAQPYGSCARST
jgi:hypothetical protein